MTPKAMTNPLSSETFTFESTITTHDVGGFDYTVVYVPEELLLKLPLKKYPRLRVEASICGVRTEAALQPCRGTWYLMVPKRIQKAASVGIGDQAYVQFVIADQEHVNVPIELMHVIESRKAVLKVWESLTPGKKRGYAHRVNSAKRDATKYRRIEEIVEELEGFAE